MSRRRARAEYTPSKSTKSNLTAYDRRRNRKRDDGKCVECAQHVVGRACDSRTSASSGGGTSAPHGFPPSRDAAPFQRNGFSTVTRRNAWAPRLSARRRLSTQGRQPLWRRLGCLRTAIMPVARRATGMAVRLRVHRVTAPPGAGVDSGEAVRRDQRAFPQTHRLSTARLGALEASAQHVELGRSTARRLGARRLHFLERRAEAGEPILMAGIHEHLHHQTTARLEQIG